MADDNLSENPWKLPPGVLPDDENAQPLYYQLIKCAEMRAIFARENAEEKDRGPIVCMATGKTLSPVGATTVLALDPAIVDALDMKKHDGAVTVILPVNEYMCMSHEIANLQAVVVALINGLNNNAKKINHPNGKAMFKNLADALEQELRESADRCRVGNIGVGYPEADSPAEPVPPAPIEGVLPFKPRQG